MLLGLKYCTHTLRAHMPQLTSWHFGAYVPPLWSQFYNMSGATTKFVLWGIHFATIVLAL